MASEVLNNVYEGRNAPAGPALSIQQVKDAIGTMRNRLIDELARAGRFQRKGFMVTLEVTMAEGTFHGKQAQVAQLPSPPLQAYGVKPFQYVGYPGLEKPLKLATGSPRNARLHLLTGRVTTVFADDFGALTVLVHRPGTAPEKIEVVYIPEDPRKLVADEDPYPAPGWMIAFITEKLTQTYINHYARKNPRPVTGADIASLAMANFKPEHTDAA